MMDRPMNILLVGNGFDLAHGLPTDYKSFVNFLNVMQGELDRSSSEGEIRRILRDYEICPELGQFVMEAFTAPKDQRDPRMVELRTLMKDNFWVEYFKPLGKLGNNWVSFENKISELIQMLDQYGRSEDRTLRLHYWNQVSAILKEARLDIGAYSFHRGGMGKLVDRLQSDLDKLVRCLETYLCFCLDIVPVTGRLGAVLDIGPIDKVLSFNYTNTFERFYEPLLELPPDYCYVHGRARLDNTLDSNDMVLGIDEYLNENERSEEIEFIRFKKYYQRIFKQTDHDYPQWFRTPGPKNLYVFGHSLNVTDKDVLRYIMTQDNVHTTVFYHCKETNAKQIQNLVKVLGYDDLNDLTRGRSKSGSSLAFRKQY